MSLSDSEIQRYKRHLVLKDVGGQGQQKLKSSSVLIIGAGGLGSPMAMYLAAAGVGKLGIIDDDHVSLDNLQRQIAHDTSTIGERKVESAQKTVARLNPHVEVETYDQRLNADNALDLISSYDLVADGSDNFATRYLANDACYLAKRPLVFAAVGPYDGYVSTFRGFEQDADGNPKPTYRCIFPQAPAAGTVAPCSEIGVLGAIVGVIGTLQATEVLKELLGLGRSLSGHLLIYDALSSRFQTIEIPWNPDNPLNGRNPTITDLTIHKISEEQAVCPA